MDIQGKRVVVVAGAQGIGLAYCQLLLKHGAKVFMGDIQEEKGAQVTEDLRSQFGAESTYFHAIDVTKQPEVEAFFAKAQETLGQLDVVVGNAGITDEHDWKKSIEINLIGQMQVMSEALKYMGKDKGGNGGVIVLTASITGLHPYPFTPAYVAAKHGVVGYVRSWAMDLNYKQHGVRINCVCPTAVDTPMLDNFHRILHPDLLRSRVAEIKKSALQPSEVAEALVELIQSESYNGTMMIVSKEKGRFVATFPESPFP